MYSTRIAQFLLNREARSQGLRPGSVLILPAVAALIYPLLLAGVFFSGRLLREAASIGSMLAAGSALLMSLLFVFAVPILGFYAALRLGRYETPSVGDVRARLSAHLVMVSPPLFTLIGVMTYLLGTPNADYVVWALLWLVIIAAVFVGAGKTQIAKTSAHVPGSLRVAHGVSAALIVAGFLALHLANHVAAFWSAEAHIALMEVLRDWYRSGIVEPLLAALMLFQVSSGAFLLRARLTRPSDFLGVLQTGTGAYLAIYILSHMTAVFVLARGFLDIESDFWFAAGGKAGLLADPWNVRLIPHYALGVWALAAHAACGLRAVLLAHRTDRTIANRVTIGTCAVGAVVAIPITLALVRVHVG